MLSLMQKTYGKLCMQLHKTGLLKPKIVRKTVNGILYELDLGQLIDASIHYFGSFEENTANCLTKLLKPGMNVLDIGANIGCHTLPMAQLVGPNGQVIAFEPMNWARKKLNRNIELNDFTNITVVDTALSEKPDKKKTRFKNNWPLDHKHRPEASAEQLIVMDTLDNYIDSNNLKVDRIKIDVDGYEYKVFKGAQDLLNDQKPIILTEFGYTTNRFGDKVEDMVDYLKEIGYEFFEERSLNIIEEPISKLESSSRGSHITINVVLKHNEIEFPS